VKRIVRPSSPLDQTMGLACSMSSGDAHKRKWVSYRGRVCGVGRDGDNPKAVCVYLDFIPDDKWVREFHDYIRSFR